MRYITLFERSAYVYLVNLQFVRLFSISVRMAFDRGVWYNSIAMDGGCYMSWGLWTCIVLIDANDHLRRDGEYWEGMQISTTYNTLEVCGCACDNRRTRLGFVVLA